MINRYSNNSDVEQSLNADKNVQQEFYRQRNFLEKQLRKFTYSMNHRNGHAIDENVKLRKENILIMDELEKTRKILNTLQKKNNNILL